MHHKATTFFFKFSCFALYTWKFNAEFKSKIILKNWKLRKLNDAMERPQHGNPSTRNGTKKKPETSPTWIFLRCFLFFQKISEIPQIWFLEEFPVFFYPFPRLLGRISVYTGLIFLRDFPIFSIRFLILWVCFWFSEKVVNS